MGFLYRGTGDRCIAQLFLADIGKKHPPASQNIDQESYSLTAALALGHVLLGQVFFTNFSQYFFPYLTPPFFFFFFFFCRETKLIQLPLIMFLKPFVCISMEKMKGQAY